MLVTYSHTWCVNVVGKLRTILRNRIKVRHSQLDHGMKELFRQGFKIYKYLSIVFFLCYWVYVVIDDYVFIEKYWKSHWLEYLGLWTVYFLTYFIGFSFYFWIAAVVVIYFLSKENWKWKELCNEPGVRNKIKVELIKELVSTTSWKPFTVSVFRWK